MSQIQMELSSLRGELLDLPLRKNFRVLLLDDIDETFKFITINDFYGASQTILVIANKIQTHLLAHRERIICFVSLLQKINHLQQLVLDASFSDPPPLDSAFPLSFQENIQFQTALRLIRGKLLDLPVQKIFHQNLLSDIEQTFKYLINKDLYGASRTLSFLVNKIHHFLCINHCFICDFYPLLKRIHNLQQQILGVKLFQPNPLDQFLEDGDLKLVEISVETFNALSKPLKFSLSGTEFTQDLSEEIKLSINGKDVPSTKFIIEPHIITATSVLVEGKNAISLSALDAIGRPLYFNTTLWAGNQILYVDIIDQYGLKILDPVEVRVYLSDDQSVFALTDTITGTAIFPNLPISTLLIQATTSENRFGFIGVIGTQGYTRIHMLGFNAPSPIYNNDFSLGTMGWDTGTAPVKIVTHNEEIPDQPFEALAVTIANIQKNEKDSLLIVSQPPTSQFDLNTSTGSIVNNDLILYTTGQGEQSISRTFNTIPGITTVSIRYRFITSEVPGGFFGSQFNDYFRVSLRSQRARGFACESNSMNGLGLAAFDYTSGATNWRNVTLQVNPQGDVIQIDVSVANVEDELFDSLVEIDFVEEVRDQVHPSIAWNNTQGGIDLSFRVENDTVMQSVTINVFWSNGTGYVNRIGDPIFSYNVPVGTTEGQYGPVHIDGNFLADDPAGVTHLIATSSETSVEPLADVRINFGPNANATAVNPATIDIIKDGLRAAGQSIATISSTTRSPHDQARAMFQNLVRMNDISHNIATQLDLYRTPGDAVINVFIQQTQGLTYQQISQNRMVIQAAMEREINNQGPQNVSRHCADPALRNIVDVDARAFNVNNARLFINAIQGRVHYFLDERQFNYCFHLEI
jgi:hypothetical protein